MDSPQKENGYTPMANEILDALAKTDLTSSESRILRVVWRKTYGWNKKEDKISLSQFQALTGLSRQMVCHAIKSLVKRGLLGSQTSLTRETTTYWFIKHYKKWLPSQRHLTSQTRLTRGSQTSFTKVVKPALPTKDNTKDIYKTTTGEGLKAPSSTVLKNQKGQVAYDMFCAKYKEVTGTEYIPQWPKDMKLLKPILPHIKSSDHWGRVLDAYFSDSFAQTTKFTFGVLISGINRYNKESHDNIPVG